MAERSFRNSIRARITTAAAVTVELVLIVGALLFVFLLNTTLVDNVRTAAEADATDIAARIDAEGISSLDVDDDDDDDGDDSDGDGDDDSGSDDDEPGSGGASGGGGGSGSGGNSGTGNSNAQRFFEVYSEDGTRFFQIYDGDGTLIASTENARSLDLASTPSTAEVPGQESPFALASDTTGDYLVVAGRTLDEVDAARNAVIGLMLFAVPLLGAVIAVLSWLIVGRALRPVERMRLEVDEVSASNLDRRLADPGTSDEIGRLAETMNRMLARLQQSQKAQRQFVSDASHELRSPLASLRQYAEVAQTYPDKLSAQELADAMQDEGSRLERIVQSMLVLARADEHSLGHAGATVDLDDLVLAEASRLRASTETTVDTSAVGPARVLGDEGLLGQVVRNLADNGTRHAASTVAFGLAVRGSNVVLTVDDDGSGVPANERERIFDRFVRLDEARGRDAGGSGLGLAIVRALVGAHGGTVRVSESPLGGARFEVRLAAASSD